MDKKAKHVMVLPFPAQGHITPMIQFSKRLMSKGVKVTLVSAFIEPLWVRANISIEDISADEPEGEKASSNIDRFFERFHQLVREKLPQVVEKYKDDATVNYLVYDSIIPWALDIATKIGLRAAPLFTQPWAVNAIHYALHRGLIKLPLSNEALPVTIAPGFPPLNLHDLPSFIYDSESFPTMLDFLKNQFSNLEQADCVLCNTFDALEQEVLRWVSGELRVKNIGPTVPSMYTDKRIEDDTDYGINVFEPDNDGLNLMEWLDSKGAGSVVYVAFGSVATMREEQIEEIARGLRNTDKPFVWVVREAEAKKLPRWFTDEAIGKGKGVLVSWCNQLKVISHEAIGCFVSHCGWNSTMEALCLGVPMVCVPIWSDQPTNAKFVSDLWGFGLRPLLDRNGLVSAHQIQICIINLIKPRSSIHIRHNSNKWKQLAIAAIDQHGTSDTNILQFVANL